ncbi:MAG: YceI family protein [Planctomycetota bacterium]
MNARTILTVLLALGILLLALAPMARAQSLAPFEFASESGRFVAKVEKPKNARRESDFDLAVYEHKDRGDLVKQWSMPYEHRGFATNHLLAADGAIVVRVDDRLLAKEPIVELFKKGQTLARLRADELFLDPANWGVDGQKTKDAPWLAEVLPPLRIYRSGAEESLQLLARDGQVRSVSFDRGILSFAGDPRAQPIAVAPGIPERFEISDARVCVDTWSAPDLVVEDEPCAVKLAGKFEVPGSQLVGFAVREDPDRRLVLLPLFGAPTANHTVSRDITAFDTTAFLTGLRPGMYSLRIENCKKLEKHPAREIEVLPAGLVAVLRTTGGIAARDHVVRLFTDDVAQTANGDGSNVHTFFAPESTAERLGALLPGELGEPAIRDPEDARPPSGADLQRYEITWVRGTMPMGGTFFHTISRVTRYDTTLNGAYRQIADMLAALKPPAPATRRYVIAKDSSSIRVKTESAGMLSAFGHDHELAARDIEGEVTVDPRALEQATVRVVVGAGSLAIVDDGSKGDAQEIEATTRDKVLESARFPKITFTSTKVEVVKRDGDKTELKITGTLDLHGTVKTVGIVVNVEIAGDLLRARATFGLKQTDYGIQPTSAAAGTVKVDDKVKVEVELLGRAP